MTNYELAREVISLEELKKARRPKMTNFEKIKSDLTCEAIISLFESEYNCPQCPLFKGGVCMAESYESCREALTKYLSEEAENDD